MKKMVHIYIPGPAGHLANEQELLTSLKSGIGIMILGTVIHKSTVVLMWSASVFGLEMNSAPAKPHFDLLGIILVATGIGTTGYAYYRFCFREKQLRSGEIRSTDLPALFLTLGALLIGLLLFSYLLNGA